MKTFKNQFAASDHDALKAQDIHREWHQGVDKDYRQFARMGGLFIFGFLGIFVIWGLFAPLKGAATATGRVIAEGENSIVQHLEGGILSQLFVREGEFVQEGQEIALVDPTQSEVETNRLKLQLESLMLQKYRLEAESNLRSLLVFPSVNSSNEELATLKSREEKSFQAGRAQLLASRRIIEQRIKALHAQLSNQENDLRAAYDERELLQGQMAKFEYLFSKQLIEESRLSDLRRNLMQIESRIEQSDGAMRALFAQLKELEEQAKEAEIRYRSEATQGLREVEVQIKDISEQLKAATARLERVKVVAPKEGVIFRIPKKTLGAVLSPGDIVAEILPTGEDFIVEVELAAKDIDLISLGQRAELRFNALSNRNPPIAYGVVDFISPDIVLPQNNQSAPYYPIRVRIDEESWPNEVERSSVVPGMEVNTFIITESRSMFSYILEPILESASFALREP